MRSLHFVDACGGSLAAMGALLAARAGFSATAHTTIAPDVDAGLVRRALTEIGVAAEAPAVLSGAAPADGDTVLLAHDAATMASPIPGARLVDAPFYVGPMETEFGPAELERIALMRVSRDRIEQLLERLPRAAHGISTQARGVRRGPRV
jgi:hypothetical protein